MLHFRFPAPPAAPILLALSALIPALALIALAPVAVAQEQASAFPPAPRPPAQAWQPVEQVKTYAVSGSSGMALYQSIGERGPSAGLGAAIAHTAFKLTWTRDYRPQPDGSCTLAVARPKLIVTYTMPKASKDLPAGLREKWQRFITGVEKHERVHGDQIVEMVRGIEAFSIGLNAPDDPQCHKVRARLQARLKGFSDERVRQSRDYDKVELTEGGAVHQLILALVNEP